MHAPPHARIAASRRAAPALARGALLACASLLCVASLAAAAAAEPEAVRLGLGTYYTRARDTSADSTPPVAAFRTGAALERAAPTNQWYSSVMFQRWSQPLHAHPMTYRATEQGFELGLPTPKLVIEDGGGKREMHYPHAAAITVEPLGFKPRDARLADFSDWLARISMAAEGGESLQVTVLHGNPFSYYDCSVGDVRFRLAAAPTVLADPAAAGSDPRVLAVRIGGHAYALFGPTGASWDLADPKAPVLHLPATARYFSVAGLPNEGTQPLADTLRDFLAVAYAFPGQTRAEWRYDPKASTLRTSFQVTATAREGRADKTFMGLYPHQWSATTPKPQSAYQYDSVRGAIRLVRGNAFTMERRYAGIVPTWAGLENPAAKTALDSMLVGELAKSDQLFIKKGHGTYWIGKGIGAAAQLMSIAEAEGRMPMRDELLHQIEARLENWFDGKHSNYFVQDAGLGTFFGVPREYDSIRSMNDHHFHYGYWIMAAAHIALRDPAWGSQEKWGGMVGRIVADIATPERDRKDFPFLRNFDPYEGHSWASGTADFDAGNNQESSSEAVNAWAGVILWAEATGNVSLRDLGIYLYTSEIASIQQYWFDLDRQVLAKDFGEPYASMLFGGKYAYNSWWTEEPHQIFGINIVPLTPASTYLAANPGYLRGLVEALPGKQKAYYSRGVVDGTQRDIWQDVIAGAMALVDPDAGLALWDKAGTVEWGETRSHSLYWISSLREMGPPDLGVSADTPLYSVFRNAAGNYTYLAYNAGTAPIDVHFSSGKVLAVPAHSLARSH